MTFKSEIHI